MVAMVYICTFDEKLPSWYAVFPLGNVTVFLHDGIILVNFQDILHSHKDVNDWFGRHSRDGSAANVVNFHHFPLKYFFQQRCFFFVLILPRGLMDGEVDLADFTRFG